MATKRVLLINDHIHFGGGGDAAFMLERRILEEAGHKTFTFSVAQKVPEFATDTDYLYVEPQSRIKNKLGKFIGCNAIFEQLKQLLEKIKPDLVRLHLLSKYPADIYRALDGYNVVQTLHGPNLFCATSWGALKRDSSECEQGVGVKCFTRGCISAVELPLQMNLARRQTPLAQKNVNAFLCPSHQLAKTAESLGFSPVRYFPLSIDPEFEQLGAMERDERSSILYVGSVSEQKGVHILLEAFALVVKAIPNAQLKVAGRGKLSNYLEQQTHKLQLNDNVKLFGFVGREEVLKLYRKAHVLAVPSIWREQFGLVGPEALACRTPCVGSNIGGIPEWLHDDKSGYLVPPRDANALADKLIRLLSNKKLCEQFGEYGRNYVLKNYSLEQYKKNVLGLVEEFAR